MRETCNHSYGHRCTVRDCDGLGHWGFQNHYFCRKHYQRLLGCELPDCPRCGNADGVHCRSKSDGKWECKRCGFKFQKPDLRSMKEEDLEEFADCDEVKEVIWDMREKREAMMRRIDENGLLSLTMKDMKRGTKFESATLNDIGCSHKPGHAAKHVVLFDGNRMKILKSSGLHKEEDKHGCRRCQSQDDWKFGPGD